MQNLVSQLLNYVPLVALAYGLLLLLAAAFQRRLLYFPPRGYPVTPAALGLPFAAEEVTTSDGLRLAAWWVPGEKAGAPVLLYFHGNAANLSSLVELAPAFRAAGFSFAAVDYRGYGTNPGRPTEAGLRRDAMAAWEWALRHGVPPGRVVVYGQSLGAGVAAWLASQVPCGGLVLESSFPSVYAMSRLHYPFLWLPEFAILDRYPAAADAARAKCPVLVLHGELDAVSPVAFGRRVFEAAREPKRFMVVPGADHNSIEPRLPVVRAALEEFRKICGLR